MTPRAPSEQTPASVCSTERARPNATDCRVSFLPAGISILFCYFPVVGLFATSALLEPRQLTRSRLSPHRLGPNLVDFVFAGFVFVGHHRRPTRPNKTDSLRGWRIVRLNSFERRSSSGSSMRVDWLSRGSTARAGMHYHNEKSYLFVSMTRARGRRVDLCENRGEMRTIHHPSDVHASLVVPSGSSW